MVFHRMKRAVRQVADEAQDPNRTTPIAQRYVSGGVVESRPNAQHGP